MANHIYRLWKQSIMKAGANTSLDQNDATNGPYCVLLDTGAYTYSAAHDFYNDYSAGIVGSPVRITTPTVNGAVFDGDNLTFSAVSGNSVEALGIHRQNSGANTTWPLVAYLDTGVTGLPVTPNGGDITVTWNASGIFSLGADT